MFKKAKTNPTPVEAAEIFRRAIVDATDAAERAHVGLPAMITVLANATDKSEISRRCECA